MRRRDFLRHALAAPLAAAPLLPANPPNLKITGLGFLKLQFPGRTPVKRNSIITSGGGAPGMTLVEVYTDGGVTGRAVSGGAHEIMTRELLPRIKGENPFYVERLWDRMYHHNRKPVAKGEYIRAMGPVDIAIWDIVGKALGQPAYRVLGAYTDRIRVYAAGGYYEEGKGIRELCAEMEEYAREGFRAIKMKVGGEAMRTDAERVAAVRKALGPDIDILIDANNKWNAYDAIKFGRMVEKHDIYWFEEPVEPDDFRGCAEVRQALDMPIVAGENEFTVWGARDLIEARSADILNLDTVWAGGFTAYRKIAALAAAHHVPVAPHGNPHMAVHLLASTANTLIMETYPAVESKYNLALPLFPVKDGYITAPQQPGVGVDPDPEIIRKYKVS